MKRSRFSVAAFKVLSKNDSGLNEGHQGGILIPAALRGYFPRLDATTAEPVPQTTITLLIQGVGRGLTPVETCYRKQTWNMTRSGETRITGNLDALRGSSRPGDILLVERSRTDLTLYRAKILPKDTDAHRMIEAQACGARWGFLPGYRDGELASDRRLIARLDRIEATRFASCFAYEFDCIDADLPPEELDTSFSNPEVTAPFALTRIISPEQRLAKMLGARPREGMWIELLISPGGQRDLPRAAIAQLMPGGYKEQDRGVVSAMRMILDSDEPPQKFPEAGASVPRSTAAALAAIAKCGIPPASAVAAAPVLKLLRPLLAKAASIVVHDVGQASFVSIISGQQEQLLHFDAGWPISFNGKTAPKKLPVAEKVPVVLSHWDWDHLHAYHSIPALAQTFWIVPQQPVGPGATKIAKALHKIKKLMTYAGADIALGNGVLIACKGPSGMNDTGLALDITLANGRAALLVGDAGYAHLGAAVTGKRYDLLVVTHHGADFAGAVPSSGGVSPACVVSVGLNNVYGHPRASALQLHTDCGWNITRTSRLGKTGRGDRTLS